MAENLDIKFQIKFNWGPSYSPVRNEEFIRKEAGAASLQEYEQKTGLVYLPFCFQLWGMPQVNWDGKLLGCCNNRFGDFGNIFESGLGECLKNEKYIYAKKCYSTKKTRETICLVIAVVNIKKFIQ